MNGLGQIVSDDQVLELVFPRARITSVPGFNQAARASVASAIASRRLPFDFSSQCGGGTRPVAAMVTGTGGSAALKFGGATGPAAPFVIAAGALLTVFGLIFSHHARAVAKERGVLCAAVPAANDAIEVIDQAVRAGAATPEQGSQALDQLTADFASTIQPILKMDQAHCNAACVITQQLAGVVARLKADYQAIAAQRKVAARDQATVARTQPSAPGVPTIIVGTGKGSIWPWIIGAGAAAYALL